MGFNVYLPRKLSHEFRGPGVREALLHGARELSEHPEPKLTNVGLGLGFEAWGFRVQGFWGCRALLGLFA